MSSAKPARFHCRAERHLASSSGRARFLPFERLPLRFVAHGFFLAAEVVQVFSLLLEQIRPLLELRNLSFAWTIRCKKLTLTTQPGSFLPRFVFVTFCSCSISVLEAEHIASRQWPLRGTTWRRQPWCRATNNTLNQVAPNYTSLYLKWATFRQKRVSTTTACLKQD